jgi:hypothetical protein
MGRKRERERERERVNSQSFFLRTHLQYNPMTFSTRAHLPKFPPSPHNRIGWRPSLPHTAL